MSTYQNLHVVMLGVLLNGVRTLHQESSFIVQIPVSVQLWGIGGQPVFSRSRWTRLVSGKFDIFIEKSALLFTGKFE